GARPLAVVNCLNFGNPEHAEVMWQLSEAIDGMAEACDAFGVPVIGGNVSLYNESQGADIDPSPVIGLLGLVDRLDAVPPGLAWAEGDRLLLVGSTEGAELGGSAWAFARGHRRGSLPPLHLPVVRQVADAVCELVADGVVSAAHDVSSGGLGVCLAEMAIAAGVGARLARIADHADLFSEAVGRVLLAVHPDRVSDVEARLARAGVASSRIGLATADRLVVKGLVDVALSELTSASERRLPEALGHGTTQD
ncbi:MAG: AIR synthase related protein, partial [Acidimicrobiia bacterium]|nr:AIR synthase related protein [Acidimicrobiia bacterium]